MNCTQVQDLAAAIIDHESIGSDELTEIQNHLSTCPSCRYEYQMDELTSRILRTRVPFVGTPVGTYRSIMSAIEEY
jgi:predicted anti-sigma-YlaC factor YlaD